MTRGMSVVLAIVVVCNQSCGSSAGSGDAQDIAGTEVLTQGDLPAPDLGSDLPGQELPPPDTNDPEAVPDVPETAECGPGEQRCLDDATAVYCQDGIWVTYQVCAGDMVCLAGGCVTEQSCEPGEINGCYSLAAQNLCHASGKGYVPLDCSDGEKCVDGDCMVVVCVPFASQCMGPESYEQCLPDGSGWEAPVWCEDGETCVGGKCLSGCAGDIKYNLSNVGCEFWSLDLGQWHVKPGESNLEPSASTIPHAVVVGNPNEVSAKVTFEAGDGTPIEIPDPMVPPGETRAFLMPVMSLQDSGITSQSIRLRTNHPVTAAQFNPPSNEDFVYTSDASLLYPTTILGQEHFVVSLPSKIGMELPMLGKMPSVWGFVSVVAVEPGATSVTVVGLASDTEPGPDFPGYLKGQTFTVELQQWEVLTVDSLATDLLGPDLDFTGTQVISDRKTAVFSGHQCYVVGDSNCDHMETQLLPVEAWGTKYVAARMNTPAPNEYRVVSGSSGNTIATSPPVAGLDGQILDKGDWVHVKSGNSFEIQSQGPIQVIQFIAGNSDSGPLVDPSMTVLIPTQQFRSDYPLLVPTAYDENFVTIVREGQSAVHLNGQPVTDFFQPIPGTGWEVANTWVPEGVNQIEGDGPFGLTAYGYATKVSYAYPGGLNGASEE